MAGRGSRRGAGAEEVRIGSGNVFAALETLKKKKKPAAGAQKQAVAGKEQRPDVVVVVRPNIPEVVVQGQDKVYKDVIEPLERVCINTIPTSKQDIGELGPPDQNDVDGRAYYTFVFTAQAPNYTRHALGAIAIANGSEEPQREKVGKVTADQVRAIAQEKLPDLNCKSIDSTMRIIAGTAANMGIDVDPPILEKKEKDNLLSLVALPHYSFKRTLMRPGLVILLIVILFLFTVFF